MLGSEFWSAIAGAIVGGLIALGVQLLALREARSQRNEDRQQSGKALGHALLLKMMRIHSNTHNLHRYIEESFENAAKQGVEGEPWQLMLASANIPDRVQFSTDELAMLLELKDPETFNALISMDAVHNSLIDAFSTFSQRRTSLIELLPAHMEGVVGRTELTQEQVLVVRPRMIEVNQLIEVLRARAKADFEESGAVLQKLGAVLERKLGLIYKLESTVVPPA